MCLQYPPDKARPIDESADGAEHGRNPDGPGEHVGQHPRIVPTGHGHTGPRTTVHVQGTGDLKMNTWILEMPLVTDQIRCVVRAILVGCGLKPVADPSNIPDDERTQTEDDEDYYELVGDCIRDCTWTITDCSARPPTPISSWPREITWKKPRATRNGRTRSNRWPTRN